METTHLLDDAAMATFVRDGYVVLTPEELPASLHRQLYAEADALSTEARAAGGPSAHLSHLGDNLLARIPAFRHVLDSPTLRGAVQSVLGEGAVLHPHHFLHRAGRTDQGFHQDGNLPWNARGHVRSHRPIAALVFYYPQDVTEEFGPTEVLPGTQYWNGRFEDDDAVVHDDDRIDRSFDTEATRLPDLAERDRRLAATLAALPFPVERRRLVVPAGSIVLAHHDVIHRGTRQAPGCEVARYMAKFTFVRVQEPVRPTWRSSGGALDIAGCRPDLAETAQRVWSWLHGDAPTPAGAVAAHAQNLRSAEELTRRSAGHELGWWGEETVATLVDALDDPAPVVRRMAAFALGETRTSSPAAVAALVGRLADNDSLVRSNAAFALGGLARVGAIDDAAIDALLLRLDPSVEPDNLDNAGLSRSTVRQSLAGALLQVAANGRLDPDRAAIFAAVGLSDHDRYVRGLTVAALATMAGSLPSWAATLVSHLQGAAFAPAPPLPVAAGAGVAPTTANLWNSKR